MGKNLKHIKCNLSRTFNTWCCDTKDKVVTLHVDDSGIDSCWRKFFSLFFWSFCFCFLCFVLFFFFFTIFYLLLLTIYSYCCPIGALWGVAVNVFLVRVVLYSTATVHCGNFETCFVQQEEIKSHL